jgi:RHS repeat-associated protein
MTNLQEDVIAIVNTSNVAVVEYSYDAWGTILGITGSMATTLGTQNPFRYRGYFYDVETGLYYLQSRYYNPQWGRFINADGYVSTGTGMLGYNMFAYCNNNPINMIDYEGQAPLKVARYLLFWWFFGDGVGSILNNFGHWLHDENMGTVYTWEANYVYYKTYWS